MAEDDEDPGWYGDPGDLHRERFYDGGGWTYATRRGRRRKPETIFVQKRSPLVPIAVGLLLLAVLAGAFAWYYDWSTKRADEAAQALVEGAPDAAEVAAIRADVHNLQVQVTSMLIATVDSLPTVKLAENNYVVSDGTTTVPIAASSAAADAGITGTTHDDWCVWVENEDGDTWHANATGEVTGGTC